MAEYCANANVKGKGDEKKRICILPVIFTSNSCVGDSFQTDRDTDYIHHDSSVAQSCPLYSDTRFSKEFINYVKKTRLELDKLELEKEMERIDKEIKK